MKVFLRIFYGLLLLAVLNLPNYIPVFASDISVSVSPETKEVANGESFTLDIVISTDVEITAWAFEAVYFDSTKLECTDYVEGSFLKDYADSHDGSSGENPIGIEIDNDEGIIYNLGYYVMGTTSGPEGDGTLCTLNFKAKDNVNSVSNITLEFGDFGEITDSEFGVHTDDVTINNGTVQIGDTTSSPAIESFSPSSAGEGDTVTINGSKLTGATSVTFGGTEAESFDVVSDSKITAVVGEGASGNVSVVTGGGSANKSGFTFIPAPILESFTPEKAAKGVTVSIIGEHLSGATSVKFGGTSASSFEVVSDTSISAEVGSGSNGEITVVTPGGTDSISGFTYISTTPKITGISPETGGAGTEVEITGSNFVGDEEDTSITICNISPESFTVDSSTKITVVLGGDEDDDEYVDTFCLGDVSITVYGATVTKDNFFTYGEKPEIDSFSPESADTGDSVTITGEFFTEDSEVYFGDTEAESVEWKSSTKLVAEVGDGTSGSVKVVTVAGEATKSGFVHKSNSGSSNNDASQPAITSFSPTSGGSGTSIVITGTNFTNVTAVKFGGVDANDYSATSSTRITATVGSGTSGSVSVVTSAGTATKTGFTFTQPESTAPTASNSSTGNPAPQSSGQGSSQSERSTANKTSNKTVTQPVSSSNTSFNSRTSGILDLLSVVDNGGKILADTKFNDIQIGSGWRISLMEINSQTRALTSEGSPVEEIRVGQVLNPASPPIGCYIVNAFEIQPSGATFSIPIDINLEYDPASLPGGVSPGSLKLASYDEEQNKWIDCDYTLDTAYHRFKARLSHLGLFAVYSGNYTAAGFGWSLAGIIIGAELLIGAFIIFYFLKRKSPLVSAGAALPATAALPLTGSIGNNEGRQNADYLSGKPGPARSEKVSGGVIWDQFLSPDQPKGEAFKTHMELTGGKLIIPRDGKSADIELINSPDCRINISLEYDPELHPKGVARILILGTIVNYEKSKETR